MPEPHTPQLVILGSSSGWGSAHRAASAYLIDLGSRSVLVDCGDAAAQGLLAAGYVPDEVSDVFISHTHSDHIGGLPYLLQQRRLTHTDRPFTIHCPAEAIEPLQDILRFCYQFVEQFPFPLDHEALNPASGYTASDITITPHPTSHLVQHGRYAAEHGYPNRGECYAFRIAVGPRVILYSADLGRLSDLDDVPEPIDWLLIETSHLDLSELWTWASRRGVQRLILTHLKDDFDHGIAEAGSLHTSAEIMIAEDGMRLPII